MLLINYGHFLLKINHGTIKIFNLFEGRAIHELGSSNPVMDQEAPWRAQEEKPFRRRPWKSNLYSAGHVTQLSYLPCSKVPSYNMMSLLDASD